MGQQQDNSTTRAALYMRLSRDDDGSGESASISTQRMILQAFAQANGMTVVGEYVDDGYSGTNYDRPDFLRMLSDIEAGNINCVITKDLSRLGRNSAKTTDYLDEYFPAHNVRYIAINDGYDSLDLSNGTIIATPFMLLVNELYARDTSQKIRAAFKVKMEKGDYISAFAVYGYRKDPDNKNHLIIDPDSANIVRSLFEMAADGKRSGEIATILNDRHVPTPAEYRCLTHPNLDIDNYSKRKKWDSTMVCKMLSNTVYLGWTEQGKTTKVSYKSKASKKNKPEDRIVVKGTHEPIVSEELFDLVRRRTVARRCVPNRGFVNIFSGVAICADCGRNMTTAPTRKKGSTYNLSCGGYKSYGADECSNHFIDYDVLYRVVKDELSSMLSMTDDDRQDILDALKQDDREKIKIQDGRQEDLQKKKEKRLQEVNLLIKKAFELFALGKQSADTYDNLMADYEQERQELELSIKELQAQRDRESLEAERYKQFFDILDSVEQMDDLTPGLVKKLIDRIEVEQGHFEKDSSGKKVKHQTIRIYYRFIGCLDDAP